MHPAPHPISPTRTDPSCQSRRRCCRRRIGSPSPRGRGSTASPWTGAGARGEGGGGGRRLADTSRSRALRAAEVGCCRTVAAAAVACAPAPAWQPSGGVAHRSILASVAASCSLRRPRSVAPSCCARALPRWYLGSSCSSGRRHATAGGREGRGGGREGGVPAPLHSRVLSATGDASGRPWVLQLLQQPVRAGDRTRPPAH